MMGMLVNFVAKIAGKNASKELNLQEGPMDGTKPWYKSKTILASLIGFLVATYGLVGQYLVPAFGFHLPAIPGMLLQFLSAMGLYGRLTADTKIG